MKYFNEVFKDNKDGTMTVRIDILVGKEVFKKDTVISNERKINGTKFYKFRYFNLAGVYTGNTFIIQGFYPTQ